MFEIDDIDREMMTEGIGADVSQLRDVWQSSVHAVLQEATLTMPRDSFQASGGREGRHTEHLGRMLAEVQWMQRSYPGLSW